MINKVENRINQNLQKECCLVQNRTKKELLSPSLFSLLPLAGEGARRADGAPGTAQM
jgi:hypothetical protein